MFFFTKMMGVLRETSLLISASFLAVAALITLRRSAHGRRLTGRSVASIK
jgi:hypothetical protein